ncbi:Predicted acyltransferase, LPLAT superfamily [Arboricoccus pini]|uniref:Predicted acyltransferase, LPLAT superfamily n=1 Tax=Arboricoccus pini TaxID=1963835 RepID=A0A212R444_9PROT|nr:hypothetical protein [Arboricoccus pini]SNB66777.1 Predicted acyltransferase, LPLAT superfamily [Arboricoccus pini]
MNTEWSRKKERGNRFVLRLMAWLTVHLGWRFGHTLLYPITLYFLLASDRRASRQFLATALGRKPGWLDLFRHYFTFASTIFDRAFVLQSRLEGYKIEVEGMDMVRAWIAKGQGCLLLGAHLGSFEILRALADQASEIGCPVPVKVLMYAENSTYANEVFAALNPARLDDIIQIGTPDAMLRVKEELDRGALVGMLGDRVPAGEKVEKAMFMGRPAYFAIGPFILAAILKVPVILFHGILRGGRHYEIRFELLTERLTLGRDTRQTDLAHWVQLYADKLAARALEAPYNWFNFYDFWSTGAAPASDSPSTPAHDVLAPHPEPRPALAAHADSPRPGAECADLKHRAAHGAPGGHFL